ncbi:MAG: hypothetical protein NTU84_10350 [Verrucomicrobia bacterium]|nr:hypothetical protein [Verrucomicrobiota bacterium]
MVCAKTRILLPQARRRNRSHTIDFSVTLKPDEEKIVTYRVHYSW